MKGNAWRQLAMARKIHLLGDTPDPVYIGSRNFKKIVAVRVTFSNGKEDSSIGGYPLRTA